MSFSNKLLEFNHEETVFDWEAKEPQTINGKGRELRRKKSEKSNKDERISKIDNSKERKQQFNKPPGPWGYPETPLRGPTNYLKKNEGIRLMKTPLHKCQSTESRPPVPKRNDYIKPSEKPRKNYKIENIKTIRKIPLRQPAIRYVYTRTGSSRVISNSGSIPQLLQKPSFGKVPKYITKVKDMIAKYKQKLEEVTNSQLNAKDRKPGLKLVNQEERLEILIGLKENLKELQNVYQRLPVYIDTDQSRQRKIKLEEDLSRLEKDITLFESSPMIYVCDD